MAPTESQIQLIELLLPDSFKTITRISTANDPMRTQSPALQPKRPFWHGFRTFRIFHDRQYIKIFGRSPHSHIRVPDTMTIVSRRSNTRKV